jgi:hypothetical protein
MMRRFWFVPLLVLSCGDDNPVVLGPKHTPIGAEMQAGQSSAANLQSQVEFKSSSDPQTGLGSAIALPTSASLAIKVGRTVQLGGQGEWPDLAEQWGAVQATLPQCASIGASMVTYNQCDLSSGQFSGQINGTISRSGDTTSFNLMWTLNGSTFSGTTRITGAITITTSMITGNLRMDQNYTSAGVGYNLSTTVAMNLGYQASPFCLTSGTLLVQRTGTGMNGSARLTWTGCNMFQVEN